MQREHLLLLSTADGTIRLQPLVPENPVRTPEPEQHSSESSTASDSQEEPNAKVGEEKKAKGSGEEDEEVEEQEEEKKEEEEEEERGDDDEEEEEDDSIEIVKEPSVKSLPHPRASLDWAHDHPQIQNILHYWKLNIHDFAYGRWAAMHEARLRIFHVS